jgi:hypothetical protein
MAKYMHNKQFEVKGFIQNVTNMDMAQTKFIVTVSNDKHCTVSVAPDNESIPIQYCIDFTKVLRAMEGDNG